MDMIIRHARLKSRPGTWDIGITGDRFIRQSTRITTVVEQYQKPMANDDISSCFDDSPGRMNRYHPYVSH